MVRLTTRSRATARNWILRSWSSPCRLDRSLSQAQRVIGLIYLAIGIYVLFRRWTAPRATHFYLFCLVSFALFTLKYTGKLDRSTGPFFGSTWWRSLCSPHYFSILPSVSPRSDYKNLRRRWLLPLVYAPGAALLGLWVWAIQARQATELLKHRLDQTGTAYDAVFYVLAALCSSAATAGQTPRCCASN